MPEAVRCVPPLFYKQSSGKLFYMANMTG